MYEAHTSHANSSHYSVSGHGHLTTASTATAAGHAKSQTNATNYTNSAAAAVIPSADVDANVQNEYK